MPVLPTEFQGHVDELLTDFSVRVLQQPDDFVANRIFPVMPVEKESGIFFYYPRGYFSRDNMQRRGVGKEPERADFALEQRTYSVNELALAKVIDSREYANATPPYDPEEATVDFLLSQYRLRKDRDWAASFFGASIWTDWTSVLSGTPTATQILRWDVANSTPQDDVDRMKSAVELQSGLSPNVMVLGRKAYSELKSHPEIISRTQYTSSDAVTTDLLANYFEVDEVVVLRGVYNTAPLLGASDNVSMSYIAAQSSMLLVYRAPNVGLAAPTGGIMFSWRGIDPGSGAEAPIFRERLGTAFSNWFAVRCAYGFNVVSPELGIFIANVTA